MVTFGNKKNAKKRKNYFCEICDFNTFNKTDYEKHLLTIKHQSVSVGNESNKKNAKKCNNFVCDNCSKEYLSRKGLWQRKKKCIEETINNENLIVNKLTSLIMDVVKQNHNIDFFANLIKKEFLLKEYL